MSPTIWVDADACPRAVKEILFRAAERRGVDVILVANSTLGTPRNARVKALTVPKGFDVADDYIAEEAKPGDLVITQDIPLAAELVEKGLAVMDPRGREHTKDSIGERLSLRDAKEELRGFGVQTGGPSAFGEREKQAFANTFDRLLTRLVQDAQRRSGQ
jgi:uncharacterized protein YaiI (UPF0178 family)